MASQSLLKYEVVVVLDIEVGVNLPQRSLVLLRSVVQDFQILWRLFEVGLILLDGFLKSLNQRGIKPFHLCLELILLKLGLCQDRHRAREIKLACRLPCLLQIILGCFELNLQELLLLFQLINVLISALDHVIRFLQIILIFSNHFMSLIMVFFQPL